LIDVIKITYSLVLLTPAGGRLDLTLFLRNLSWEENDGELAVRLEAELQNQRLSDGGWLHQAVPLGGQVLLSADWGTGQQEVFRGVIFAWDYHTDPLGHFTITAYDQLVYLTKSKDDRYYGAGQTARAIIQDIAKAWGIPLGDVQGPGTALAKQVFRGESLADMILSVIEQAKQRGAGEWLVRSRQGKIDVIRPGQNRPVYCFAADTNTSTSSDRRDIDDLVTRVKIVGAEDAGTKATVKAQLDGRTEFGVLQEIIYQRQHDTPAAARSAAQEALKERGQPRQRRRVQAPDLPFLRKGDRVQVNAGTLNGHFIATGVAHNATDRTMSLEVESVG